MSENAVTEVINSIEEGTVIDHIPAGQGLPIISMLKLIEHKKRISIGLNLSSPHHGIKDLIKVAEKEFTPEEVNCIALFAQEATISIIRNYEVVKKFQVSLPETIQDCGACPNPRCITNHEKVKSSYIVIQQNSNILLSCKYCRKAFSRDQL